MPLGPHREATTAAALREAAQALVGQCFVKATTGGYDGRSQVRISSAAEAESAFLELGGGPVVAEKALEIEAELSVLVARSPRGELAVYPPALNHHENRILAWSAIPGPLPKGIADKAMAMAREIAVAIAVEGLLVVELS